MSGFNTKNLIFSDLPTANNENFLTALGEGLDELGDIEYHKEQKKRQEQEDKEAKRLRDLQIEHSKNQEQRQEQIHEIKVEEALDTELDNMSLVKMGEYNDYESFAKEHSLFKPKNIQAAKEFFEAKAITKDSKDKEQIEAILRANNNGLMPSPKQLSSQLPSLIENKDYSNRVIGAIYATAEEAELKNLQLKKAQKDLAPSIDDPLKKERAEYIELFNAGAIPQNMTFGTWLKSKDEKSGKDPLSKERAKFKALQAAGQIGADVSFGAWLAQTGGKLDLKSESVTNAKNNLREQLTGLANITKSRIKGYDPKRHGVWDSTQQWFQETVPVLHSKESAALESEQNGFIANLTKAMYGGKATNQQMQNAKKIGGSTYNTEEGAAAQLKSAYNQAILAVEQTIGQIESAGGDASREKAELQKYKDFLTELSDWDGTTRADSYYEKVFGQEEQQSMGSRQKGLRLVNPEKKVVARGFDKRAGKNVVRYDDGSIAYVD